MPTILYSLISEGVNSSPAIYPRDETGSPPMVRTPTGILTELPIDQSRLFLEMNSPETIISSSV